MKKVLIPVLGLVGIGVIASLGIFLYGNSKTYNYNLFDDIVLGESKTSNVQNNEQIMPTEKGKTVTMNEVFEVTLIGDRIWTIEGISNDLSYLVAGNEKAMLIDTGMGVGNLKGVVESLTNLPYIVVNTHGHSDHAGGNSQFDEIWINPKDIPLISYKLSYNSSYNVSYKMNNLIEGDVIDLGGRGFEILETPGHTKGSISLLNKEEKIIFTGDTVNSVTWMHLDECTDLVTYNNSIKKISNLRDQFNDIYKSHMPYKESYRLLDDLIACTDEIIESKTPLGTTSGLGMRWTHNEGSVIYNPNNIGRK